MARNRQRIAGGLTSKQVAALSPEVRQARAAYLSDTSVQIGQSFDDLGATELPADHPLKDDWAETERGRDRHDTESLDAMAERGFQIDADGNVYPPED